MICQGTKKLPGFWLEDADHEDFLAANENKSPVEVTEESELQPIFQY